MPDFMNVYQHWVQHDTRWFDEVFDLYSIGFRRELATQLDYISYCVYQFGEHKSIWNFLKFDKYLTVAGFQPPTNPDYSDEIDGDREDRRRYSLVVEAVK